MPPCSDCASVTARKSEISAYVIDKKKDQFVSEVDLMSAFGT